MRHVVQSLGIFALVSATQFPSFLPKCPLDEKLVECEKAAILKLKPIFKTKISSDDVDIASLDPFYIEYAARQTQILNLTTRNSVLYGLSNFEITNLKLDMENMTLRVDTVAPLVGFKGFYDMEVNFMYKTKGYGKISGVFRNFRSYIKFLFSKETLDDQEYIRFQDVGQRLRIDKVKFKVESAAGEAEGLEGVATEMLNQYGRILLPFVSEVLEEYLTNYYSKLCQVMFRNVTIDQLFEEVEATTSFEPTTFESTTFEPSEER